jgi:hypothetical protein
LKKRKEHKVRKTNEKAMESGKTGKWNRKE